MILEETKCLTCRRLLKRRARQFRSAVKFFDTQCDCPRCQEIITHVKKCHPHILALVALEEKRGELLKARLQSLNKRGWVVPRKFHHAT